MQTPSGCGGLPAATRTPAPGRPPPPSHCAATSGLLTGAATKHGTSVSPRPAAERQSSSARGHGALTDFFEHCDPKDGAGVLKAPWCMHSTLDSNAPCPRVRGHTWGRLSWGAGAWTHPSATSPGLQLRDRHPKSARLGLPETGRAAGVPNSLGPSTDFTRPKPTWAAGRTGPGAGGAGRAGRVEPQGGPRSSMGC